MIVIYTIICTLFVIAVVGWSIAIALAWKSDTQKKWSKNV
jgi:hypothetical protein